MGAVNKEKQDQIYSFPAVGTRGCEPRVSPCPLHYRLWPWRPRERCTWVPSILSPMSTVWESPSLHQLFCIYPKKGFERSDLPVLLELVMEIVFIPVHGSGLAHIWEG